MPRWRIEESAYLGHFSFTKLLMWHDLEAGAEALLQNDVIRHLASGTSMAFPSQGDFPSPERLDEERHPVDNFCSLDADSTQLAAVFAAESGKTFVLEGPPGTGKSQTITNLISQCLAGGKSVLFVSEKMAALDVVHRRLESVGLGEFCLELHSNKARKRDVLDRLGRSWDALGSKKRDDWEEKADQLQITRRRLNRYVEGLHRRHPIGLSVFEAVSQLINLRDTPRVSLGLDLRSLGRDKLRDLKEAVERLQAAAEPLGAVVQHPFRSMNRPDWSPAVQQAALGAVRKLADAADELDRCAPASSKLLQADSDPMSWAALTDCRDLAVLLLRSPIPPSGLLRGDDWPSSKQQVLEWIEHGRRRDELHSALNARYEAEALLRLDVRALSNTFHRWGKAFFLFAFFALFFARRRVRGVLRPGASVPQNRLLAADLDKAVQLEDEEHYLSRVEGSARQALGNYWSAGRGAGGWDVLHSLLQWVEDFRRVLRTLPSRQPGTEVDDGRRERLRLLAGNESSVQIKGSDARRALESFVRACDGYAQRLKEITDLLSLDPVVAFGAPSDPAYLDRVRERLRSWLETGNQLRDWCHYVRVGKAIAEEGLDQLVRAHIEGAVSTEDLPDSFRRSVLEPWASNTIQTDPTLAGFHSTEHARLIRKFVDLDATVRALAKDIVRARLAQGMPDPQTGATAQSEMGILMREIQKKTRHLPIRKLFARIPTLLRRLKPCLLMSPLSVAQYMGTDYSLFDIVVFDEASQIPTHDAIGAIGRGRQLVVVGDPQQLPPTTFFSSTGDDGAAPDEDKVDELDSILEECIAAGLPKQSLGWHYRSRHESLIAFSNYNYYRNRLHTFPAATESTSELGVSWRPVSHGHYDKSNSRTNRGEAEAVVAEVIKRLVDPELQKLSIGVVTFSAAQQRLIEDLLDEARRQRPEIEPFFGGAVNEPLFVKNLENVQGDERDVMLFSICYGPDREGIVSMNFGPLNRTGGERRLNVAVTRARYQLLVFSTLTADKIDLSRTRALGVRHLKMFLDYAARGPRAIAEASTAGNTGDFDSPFEQAVHRAITERGWEAHCQVGCSQYHIDLAVVHPEHPGHYLLGIECDGANYHSAKCARDRDRLREIVLKGLGWHLHRIWSTDWWHNPKRELDKIEEALQRAREGFRPSRPDGAWASRAPEPGLPENRLKEEQSARFARAPRLVSKPSPSNPGTPYPEIPEPLRHGSAEDFYSPRMQSAVSKEIGRVIAREAPLHIQVLARRVLGCFDLKRATARAMTRLQELLVREDIQIVDGFVWSRFQDPSAYQSFRYPSGQPEQQRKLQEVPPEEIANAALAVLQQNVSLPLEDLSRETSRLLGFARTGRQIEAGMAEGLRVLENRGRCRIENGTVRLV